MLTPRKTILALRDTSGNHFGSLGSYIGETIRNVGIRWNEHNDPRKSAEPAKHLTNHLDHQFVWNILMTALTHNRTRKNLEASVIAVIAIGTS